jgi:hypothetical protein
MRRQIHSVLEELGEIIAEVGELINALPDVIQLDVRPEFYARMNQFITLGSDPLIAAGDPADAPAEQQEEWLSRANQWKNGFTQFCWRTSQNLHVH